MEYLELGSNLLKDDGCINIGKGLVNNLIIKSLGLNNNMITNKGADELCKYLINKENLFYLGLSSNEITEINEDFAKLFEWLKIIKIADNPLYPSAIINIFQSTAKNRLFKQIRFKCNDKYLFKAINSNENLKIFDLSYNDNLNINLLKNIIGLKNISKIYLQRNNINDNDIQRISQYIQEFSSHLKELYLDNNGIENKGADELGKYLKNKENLFCLGLSSNNITEINEDFAQLFEWLKFIKIADNPLYPSAIISIFQATSKNRLFKKIRFKCNDKYLFKSLSANDNLKVFDLSYNDNINIQLIKNILNLKNISKIYLQRNNINDNDIQRISNYIKEYKSHLKELHLQSNLIGVNGSESIAEMIKDNIYLKVLNITDNPLQSQGINNICNSITDSKNVISELLINSTKCNDYCIEKIVKMLKFNKNLQILTMTENKFTNKGVDKILSTLRTNNTLIQISIGNKFINYTAFEHLDEYLSFNKSLLSLEIKSSKVTDDIVKKLSKLLLINKTLSYINLVDNLITREGLISLGQYLNKNKTIKQIMALLNVDRSEEQSIKSSNPHIIFN